MLTGGLGLALLIVPMRVRIPRAGSFAMLASLAMFTIVLWNDGTVSRLEGGALVALALGLLIVLYRRSPVFHREAGERGDDAAETASGAMKPAVLLGLGIAVMVLGAELVVHGSRTLLATAGLSEVFLGMTVVGLGESLEETARMVSPARRGHPEVAWGNVVGTTVILLTLNLGLIALVSPITAAPLVLRFHVPYLVACTVLVAAALLRARTLGRPMGFVLVAFYLVYLAVNIAYR